MVAASFHEVHPGAGIPVPRTAVKRVVEGSVFEAASRLVISRRRHSAGLAPEGLVASRGNPAVARRRESPRAGAPLQRVEPVTPIFVPRPALSQRVDPLVLTNREAIERFALLSPGSCRAAFTVGSRLARSGHGLSDRRAAAARQSGSSRKVASAARLPRTPRRWSDPRASVGAER